MGFLERFSNRKAQTQDIPSGAYQDYLDTVVTVPKSDLDIDGPRTLMEGLPEEDKEQHPESLPPFVGDDLPEGRMQFDPANVDKRIYEYIKDVANPAMMEAEQVLYFLQKAFVAGIFGETHQENQTEFVQDVDFAIEMVDSIIDHLTKQSGAMFDKMDEKEQQSYTSPEDFDKWEEDWKNDGAEFKEMLKRIGDPFKSGPFDD